MKTRNCFPTRFMSMFSKVLILPALLITMLAFGPSIAQADTSANATIFNEVTVTYTSGLVSFSASDDVTLTVSTLAAAPTVTVSPTAASVGAGAQADYDYTIKSNSNGPDTYTVTVNSVDTNVSSSVDNLSPANNIVLWGGIVVGSGPGYIELPGGSLAVPSLTTDDTIELVVAGNVHQYTVAGISNGIAQSSGSPEVLGQLALTPVLTDPNGTQAITAGSVVVGAQVGEYGIITLEQTAGTPSTQGTNGTHVTNLTFETTATDAFGAVVTYTTETGDSNEVTTTVTSPNITVYKYVRNIDDTDANPTAVGTTINSETYWDSGVSGKPGETLEYVVNIVNGGEGVATDVVFSDTLSDYTTYVATSAQVDTNGDGTYDVIITGGETEGTEVSGIIEVSGASITVQAGTGGDESVPQGGQIAGGGTENSVVLYRVTIN